MTPSSTPAEKSTGQTHQHWVDRIASIVGAVAIAITAVPAAVVTYEPLRNLAARSGPSEWVAPLYPALAYAVVLIGLWVWLWGNGSAATRRFARWATLAMLAVAGTAGAVIRGVEAAGAANHLWVAACLVGVIPPIALGFSVHLYLLLARDRAAAAAG